MKKTSIITHGISMLNTMAIATAKQSANSSCLFIHHQPKLPSELMSFIKRK